MAKVAWIGLGVMGYPMAGHLKNKGGHEVTPILTQEAEGFVAARKSTLEYSRRKSAIVGRTLWLAGNDTAGENAKPSNAANHCDVVVCG